MKPTLCYSLTPLASEKTRRLRSGWKGEREVEEEEEEGWGGEGEEGGEPTEVGNCCTLGHEPAVVLRQPHARDANCRLEKGTCT